MINRAQSTENLCLKQKWWTANTQIEVKISRKRQFTSFAWQCLCPFCHWNEVLHGELQHGGDSHPTYSSNLAWANSFIFDKVKTTLKGRRFQDAKDNKKTIISNVKAVALDAFDGCCVQLLLRCEVCCNQGRVLLSKIKPFSSYIMHICSYSINPKTSLFDYTSD